ncbi:MAG TPA: tetratricopeptide repeat protein, partial [Opitutaceae bacterium]|nr:tetratricopeptide repeat protein [Opitutaceae bacterium]
DEHGRRRDYLRALGFFLVAMLCKTSVVMLPGVLLLHAWWRRRRIARADWIAAAPFFAVSLALGLVTVWLQRSHAIGDEVLPLGGAAHRIAIAGAALVFYFWKCLWPAGLMPVYPHWPIDGRSPWHFLPWIAFALVAVACFRRPQTWRRHLVLGGGWFALHLLPFLGFVPISYFRFTWVMDHFLYVPIIGVIGMVVALLDVARGTRWGAAGATAGILVLLALSRGYAEIYRDAISLWSFAAQRNPAAWPAHNNLGLALAATGKPAEAVAAFEAALAVKPDFVDAHNNLGNALLALGRPADALVHFRAILALKPNHAPAHNNLGVALRRMGEVEPALPSIRRALELKPDYAEAWNTLGNTLRDLGRPGEAVPNYEQAIRLAPTFAEAHYNLGLALADLGRMDEARRKIAEARRLNPAMPDPRF